MKLTITEKHENPYLFRTEVKGAIVFTGATPPYNEIKTAMAAQLSVPEQTIAIIHVYTRFGVSEASFTAHVYQTPEQLQKIEPKKKEKKTKEGAAESENK